ncbi:MAG: cysteine peptidase family C39 domain-containing protein [Verrucomicrobiota bacterium]|jgi:predicted double-glycine peptidase
MNLWLDGLVAATIAVTGILLGRWFARLRTPYWTFGYFIPLALILVFAVAQHVPTLYFTPPVSWMMMGRKRFAIMGFVAALILTTPLSRLPKKRDRVVVCLLMAVIILSTSVWPFLMPALDRKALSLLKTHIDADGVCIQTTDYTCGPAAAVTALHRLGLPAEEGRLAILSETSSATGTEPDILAETLRREYGKDGLSAECRPFKDIADLKRAGLTLAVVKFNVMEDHWVTVLEVTDSQVVIGDPLGGTMKMSYAEFLDRWRFMGVVLQRKP